MVLVEIKDFIVLIGNESLFYQPMNIKHEVHKRLVKMS